MHTQKCFFLSTGKLTLKNLSVLLGEAYAARRCGFPLALKDLGEMTREQSVCAGTLFSKPWNVVHNVWVGGWIDVQTSSSKEPSRIPRQALLPALP